MTNHSRCAKTEFPFGIALILTAACLFLSGCSTTHPVSRYQRPQPNKPILIRFQDRAWVLDWFKIKGDTIFGSTWKTSWTPTSDTLPSNTRSNPSNSVLIKQNEAPLEEDQMVLYLKNGTDLPRDSLLHPIKISISNVDSAAVREFNPALSGVAVVGGIIGGSFLLLIFLGILITSLPQGGG